MRDRTFERPFYRASGVNLLINAIVRWNLLYLEPAFAELNREGIPRRLTSSSTLPHSAGSTSVSPAITSGPPTDGCRAK
ncbi:Tn3 family transposase [Ensifer sp. IC3342]|nr:Tn3 family transposase [Ensifer sp. BRP08]MCA1451324.1 Tn3 family transposase [Ensifer sp. IC3342]